ncbi:MAG: hypothetical protein IT243_08850 [Bacteroidia bacterium]|nr:hypothetical protein [Bacteroidia bacterium]
MTKSLLLLMLLTCLSSCFEILEDISFKKNGSGTFKYVINLSESKTEINSLMKLDSNSGFKIPKIKEINDKLNKVEQTLKNSEGLSNIIVKRDFKNWIFEVKTDFDNCQNLEKGISNSLNNIDKRSKLILNNIFRFETNKMQRNTTEIDKTEIKKMNKNTVKKIFSKAKYTAIYRFENTIETYSNKNSKISASKNAIMISCNLLNLINGKETISNIITIK